MDSVPYVEPRHHTKRSGRPTVGGKVAKVATALGSPPMPWQRRAYDVIGELDDDGSLWYRTVILRVQRRGGKTHMFGGWATWRCLVVPGGRAWYTAQNGRYASEWMRDEYAELLRQAGIFGDGRSRTSQYVVNRRTGAEAVEWKASRARFQVFPPKKDAMHSKKSDLTAIDEAWSFTADEGRMLRQAITPTQLTRHGSQTWIISAGGTAESEFLDAQVERGKLALTDPESRVCFIDYGIPIGSDPFDLHNIAAHHPAYGHTFGMGALEAAYEEFNDPKAPDLAGFARAYGTVDLGSRGGDAIAATLWAAAGERPQLAERHGRLGVGFDVTPDGSRYAVGVAQDVGPDRYVELIASGPTARDTPAQVRELLIGLGGYATCDAVSAGAVELAEAIEKLDGPPTITRASTAAVAAAVIDVRKRLVDQTLWHPSQPDLDAAVEAAATRTVMDGATVWGRKASSGDISGLSAVTLAGRSLDTLPPPLAKPVVRRRR